MARRLNGRTTASVARTFARPGTTPVRCRPPASLPRVAQGPLAGHHPRRLDGRRESASGAAVRARHRPGDRAAHRGGRHDHGAGARLQRPGRRGRLAAGLHVPQRAVRRGGPDRANLDLHQPRPEGPRASATSPRLRSAAYCSRRPRARRGAALVRQAARPVGLLAVARGEGNVLPPRRVRPSICSSKGAVSSARYWIVDCSSATTPATPRACATAPSVEPVPLRLDAGRLLRFNTV